MTEAGIDHVFGVALTDKEIRDGLCDPEKRRLILDALRTEEFPVSNEEIELLVSLGAVEDYTELARKYLAKIESLNEKSDLPDQQ